MLTPLCLVLASALTAVRPGDVTVRGHVREVQDRFVNRRILSDFARDTVWQEARDAFAHPDDDVFNKGIGMWKGEFWGKLMISASRVAAHTKDARLKAFLHEEGLRLVAFQRPDGYLGTYVNPDYIEPLSPEEMKRRLGFSSGWNWNLWCRKYTLWGLLSCYRLTGDRTLLEAADRAMAHQIALTRRLGKKLCETGTSTMRGLPPCSILKPLLWLYQDTGKAEYLAYAKEIYGYWSDPTTRAPQFAEKLATGQPIQDWYPDELGRWGKAYEMMSCLAGIVEYARVTGDRGALNLARAMCARIRIDESNLCGSVGYNDQFVGAVRELNGSSEPCDAVHWMRLNHELWLETGDAAYVDAFERTFYNALLASFKPDGTWGARELRSHGHHRPAPPQSGMTYQHCCVNNLPRGLMDAVETMAARDADGALCLALYHDAELTLGDDRVTLSGDYPVGRVVTVRLAKKAAGAVRFRVPGWCAALRVAGPGVSETASRPGWFAVRAPAGESVWTLDFGTSARIVESMRPPVTDYAEFLPNGVPDYRMTRWCSRGDEADRDLFPLLRTTPAATVEWGPLILAKSVRFGTRTDEILSPLTVNRGGWKLTARPCKAPAGAWGAWDLEFTRGAARRRAKACDFSSADVWEPGRLAFSIFF